MLARNNRINKDVFADLLKKGVVLHSPLFSFRFAREETGAKVSFVVSKKIAANATDRNRMKRRGYSVVNALLKRSVVKFGFIGVFFYKKEGVNASFKNIKAEIETLFKKAGIV